MIIQLKEITDDSWLVITEKEQEKIGLLSTSRNGSFTLLPKGGKVNFEDKDEVTTFLAEDIFANVLTTKIVQDEKFYVKGYPVDFDHPYEADSEAEMFSSVAPRLRIVDPTVFFVNAPRRPRRLATCLMEASTML